MTPSIFPSRDQAESAQRKYLERVKKSVVSLLQSYASSTGDKNAGSAHLIERVQSLRRPLPEFFFLHDRLQQAMRRQDVADAEARVRVLLEKTSEFEATFPYLSIEAFA